MFVEQSGSAEADHIILLHSANFSGRMWRPVTDRLQEMHLVVPDMPGHGRSIDETFVSIEQTADEVAEIATQLEPGRRLHVVGVSLGAYVGLALLIRHPDLASTAALSGFHVGNMPNPRMMILMGDILSPVASTAWFQRKMASSLKIPPEYLEHEDFTRSRTNGRTIRAVNRAAVKFDARADLDRIRTRTLALAGGREHKTILESLRVMERRIADCEARIAPDLEHAWPLQDPELFADTVRAWTKNDTLPLRLEPAPPKDNPG